MVPATLAGDLAEAKPLSNSRQQARTQATRRKLLRSAEHIFARRGFEAARIEDIAAAAGYSRGAFYANFETKEDLFMALLEDFVRRRIADVQSLLTGAKTPTEQADLLRDYYARMAIQRTWTLIFLEYKLFAVRHPQVRARLQQRLQRLRAPGIEILRKISAALGHRTPVTSSTAAVAMGALSNALMLEQLVDPETLSPSDLQTLLSAFFDLITGEDRRFRGR
jgi:AcrR family transcriptional regulator